MERMQPWLAQWLLAAEEVLNEDGPYDPGTQYAYLQWYAPRTRTRLVRVSEAAPDPQVTDLFSDRHGAALHVAVSALYET